MKFLSKGVFDDNQVVVHFVVASADTRFSVANLAESELKKLGRSAFITFVYPSFWKELMNKLLYVLD